MGISKELLDILACPACKKELNLAEDGKWLVCSNCKLKYPIIENIPVMLIDKAEKLSLALIQLLLFQWDIFLL